MDHSRTLNCAREQQTTKSSRLEERAGSPSEHPAVPRNLLREPGLECSKQGGKGDR